MLGRCFDLKLKPLVILKTILEKQLQSTLNFGLEFCFIKNSLLKQLNVRQNILIKNILGIKYYAQIKPLLNELKIEQIEQLYFKHKIFGMRQLINNDFTFNIFVYINRFYDDVKQCGKNSFVSQLNDLKKLL